MSDPDQPTRRLPPTEPARPIREREVLVEEPEPPWLTELHDRLRSLRTGLAIVGVLAAAALGVALWALLSQEEEGDARRGASPERVSDLEDRVDNLEEDVGEAPSRDTVRELRDRQDELDERLAAAEEQSGGGDAEQLQGDLQQVADAVEENGQAIQDLDQRVEALEQEQDTGGTSP